jgi:hypothetical protein
MTRYHHKQGAGTLLVAMVLPAVGLVVLGFVLPREVRWISLIGVLLFAFGFLFSSLTVEISEGALRWWFGPGFLKKEVPLSTILRAEATRTRTIEGWGIHLTRRGWLYNISGYGAVLVFRQDGKTFLLGSDEPERLAAAISGAMR